MTVSLRDRFVGSLLGLACGDAVGTTVEFHPRGTFEPLTDMVGGGPFELPPGKWTDDTSMALCLAESLLHCDGFDAKDQMSRYCNWWQWGYLSSTDECFDIGNTVQQSLARFMQTGDPFAGSTNPRAAGNGSLMRLAPVPLFYFANTEDVIHFSGESSRTTHGAPEAIDCCRLYGKLLADALAGRSKAELLRAKGVVLTEPNVSAIASGAYKAKSREEIRGTGYAVQSLEAALWCFQNNDSFSSTVLEAANLGEDADTTAAIAGQIAGAHYGQNSIPGEWLAKLHLREKIQGLAEALHDRAMRYTRT
jgi:ADP-ribosyl-[dinitrogen reductase] hydrolase